MVKTNVLRFKVDYCQEDGTWAVVDNHNDGLPYAWFAHEFKAVAFCEWENNNYYYPF